MSDPIISVERLGKCYRLKHQQSRERYTTLRDVLTRKFKGLLRGNFGISASQRFGVSEDFWALRDVSFEIRPGEVVGIIGRNGAGKSTLLKILSQITEPTEGRVRIRGRVASLLEVGTGFHPELTGRENIFLNGAILGMSRVEIKRKFDEIVAFAEVEKFLDTPVKRYSSGMYVRLAFAVAAHLEPEILVVDEVLAVGDAQFQKKCLGRMSDVAQSGRTVLFVSHNFGAVRSLCSRCLYLRNGQLIEDGPTPDTLDAYLQDGQSSGSNRIPGYGKFSVESVVLRNSSGASAVHYRAGDEMVVEINYDSPEPIDGPYFWIEVYSLHGAVFSACMLFDGFRPNRIHGGGSVTCRFHHLPLMPGSYTIRMGVRHRDGVQMLMRSQEVGFFNIVNSLADVGFRGELAESLSVDAAPVVVPYTWHLPDGRRHSFEIKPTKL